MRDASVSSNTSSHSDGSLFPEETLSRKCPYASNQVESYDRRVRFVENSIFFTETHVSSKPNYSSSDSHLATLETLQRNGAIQVIYPKQGKCNTVSSATSVITTTGK